MKDLLLSLAFLASTGLIAQTWTQVPTPVDDQVFDYKIEVDNSNDRLALLPTWFFWDSLYTKTGTGAWVGRMKGEFPDGFYTANGTLFALQDLDPNANLLLPLVHMSTDNGVSFTQVPDVVGRCFHQDQSGNIFLSTLAGFKYSTDQGATFLDVSTPELVHTAAMDTNGDLYFGSYFLEMYRSTDGGTNWTDISKGTNAASVVKDLQVEDGVLYFDNSNGSYL
jgi:hypothetical protein